MKNHSNNFLLLAGFGLVCLLGLASYFSEQTIANRIAAENRRELQTELDSIEQDLASWFKEQMASAVVWANTAEVRNFASLLLDAHRRGEKLVSDLVQLELRHWLNPVHTGRGYQGYFIIAPDGISLASSRDSNIGTPNLLLEQPDFLEKIWAGQTAISLPQPSDVPLPDKNGVLRDGIPTMFAGAPIRNDQGKVVAAFTFRINPEDSFMDIFNQIRSGLSSESMAFRKDGVLIAHSRYENQLRVAGLLQAQQEGMLNTNLFQRFDHVKGLMVDIPYFHQATQEGTVYNMDGYENYRGEKVISARRWLPQFQLGIIEQVDYQEKNALLVVMRKITWSLTGFAIILMALLVYIIISGRQKILESQERLSGIIDMSDEAIISIDESERIILFNPAAQKIFGFNEAEMLGEQLSILIPERLREAHHEHVKMFLVYWEPVIQKSIGKNLVGLRKNGEEFPMEATVTRQTAGGHIVMTVALRDITERVKAQAALRREQYKVRRYLDSVQALILAIDRDGAVRLINRKGCEILGRPASEIIGQNWFGLCQLNSTEQADTRKLFQDLIENGVTGGLYHENTFNSADGRKHVIGWHSSVLKDERGKPVGILCGGIDLSDIKQAEQERDRLQRQLMRAHKSEAIGQLTGGIAHDFNNMLASISGYTELSLSTLSADDDSKLSEYLRQVQQTCRRASDLVAKLLAFSRGEESELRLTSLAKTVDSSVKLLESVLPSSIDIRMTIQDNLPDIMADPLQLDQVIVNLCINARDAMNGQGDIEVGLRRIDDMTQECVSCHKSISGSFVELSIKDNGSGIDPVVVDKIFDPFFTTKDVGKGTGMGLSLVHGVVHGHGGHIQVSSPASGGAEFRLYFPVAQGQDQAEEASPSPARQSRPVEVSESRHILLVDDEPAVTNMLAEVLRMTGFTVSSFTDSQEALLAFQASPQDFDLILTDQTMPHLTGVELARQVLAIRPEMPIVLCTGYSTAIDERSALAMGISAYFEKPMDTAGLLNKILGLLNIKPA